MIKIRDSKKKQKIIILNSAEFLFYSIPTYLNTILKIFNIYGVMVTKLQIKLFD